MSVTTTAISKATLQLAQNNGAAFPVLTPSTTFAPPQINYTAGTNAGQVDLAYAKRITVASGSPQSIDLSGGGLTTLLGDAASFARVSSIGFCNSGSNTVTLTGNFLTTRFGASFSMPLPPNARVIYDDPSATGLAVTNSSADTITITSSAGSVPVDIAIGGRSV
jgi:hypothetical protein